MSTQVKIKVPPQLEAKVRDKLTAIINDDEILNQLGDITTKEVKAKILQGKSPKTDGTFANPMLTDKWVKRKKRLATKNTALSTQAVNTKKARLAFTGEWLRSIKHFIVKSGNKKILEIRPDGKHSQYIGVRGEPIGDVVDNRTIGQGLIEQGRDWRGVSEKTTRRLVQLVKAFIRRKLKST